MRPFVLASTLLAAAIAPPTVAGLSIWVGPATGNWSLGSNWSAGVPNDLALIDGPPRSPFAVTQNINASINNLTIGAGDSLSSPDNIDTTLNGLVNNGTWFVNSAGNATDLSINAPVVTFSGGGTIQFSNNTQNRIFGINALRTLVNGAGHTIRGAGQIGFNSNLDLVNDGVIRADQPNSLTVDVSTNCANNGLLAASGSGTLVLLNSTFDNTNGVIRAEADGAISLQGANIVNGELETQGNGVINLSTNASSFSAVHLVGTLTQPDNADVTLNSSITNDAAWAQNSVGNATDISVNATTVTLNGSGVLAMSNNTQNRVFGINALRTLVNGANHTIRGSGQVGVNSNLDLVNDGVIRADQPNSLTVDVSNSCTNNGLLAASGGGTLILVNSAFDNTNGVIRAEADGAISLQGANIVNGELETQGNGVINLSTNVSSFSAVHLVGTLTQPDNADVTLNSSITNDAAWAQNSVGNATDISVNATTVTLNGSGVLAMSNNTQNRIFGINALRTLVNGANHTIRGSGQVGVNSNLDLVNDGVIRADQPNSLTVDVSNSCTNNGLLAASGGGTLILVNSAFDNTNGVIRAESDSAISLQGANIVNGELETQGNGVINLSTNVSNFSAVHLVGTLTQPDNADVTLTSSITNDAVWAQNSVGNATDIQVNAATVTLNGSGVIAMSNNAQNRIYGINALRTLVNGPNHTIRGSGQVGANSNLDFTNHGALVADAAATLTIDCSNVFSNGGTVHVTGTGSMTIQPSTFNQLGVVEVDAGGTLTRAGQWTQGAGTTIANGAINLTSGGTFQINDGIMTGGGSTSGAMFNTGGIVKPGPTGASTIGTLNVTGTYTQGTEGIFDVELGASGNDLLAVTGSASVAGKLVVRFANGFQPALGSSFTILTASSVTGIFNCVTSDPLPAGAILITYLPTSIKVTVVAGATNPADLTGDGSVDSLDLALLLGGWGENCASVCCPGDINGDGVVGPLDLGILLGAWGG